MRDKLFGYFYDVPKGFKVADRRADTIQGEHFEFKTYEKGMSQIVIGVSDGKGIIGNGYKPYGHSYPKGINTVMCRDNPYSYSVVMESDVKTITLEILGKNAKMMGDSIIDSLESRDDF